jgi:VWFA-related protein
MGSIPFLGYTWPLEDRPPGRVRGNFGVSPVTSTRPVRTRPFQIAVILLHFLFACVISLSIGLGHAGAKSEAAIRPPPAPAPSQTGSSSSQEISSHDEVTTFKVKVNLVLVRVVVRDGKGNAVGNLRQEDFELFDGRKPQVIKQFVMEQLGSKVAETHPTPEKAEEDSGSLPAPIAPEHYVAYVFDDVHLAFGDLARVRDAAGRHLTTLTPAERAAIFTTSGLGNLDFTDEHDKLEQAIRHIVPHPISRTGEADCPDVTYYMADLIQHKHDPTALSVAAADALNCEFQNNPQYAGAAAQLAESTAARVLSQGEHESRVSLSVLKDVIGRVSVMPGQRTVLLLSPGFLTPEMEYEYNELIERALRAQVIISALDARGLYTVDPLGDIRNHNPLSANTANDKLLYATASAQAEDYIMSDLANGTGGAFFRNNNDLDEGFRRVAAAPEYSYVLGFSPQNLKLDGRFHDLKVTVKNPPKLTILARRGYYAPKQVDDPAEEARQEIEDALFSQEEMHGLPVDLHTQFFKSSELDARLAVLVHVDVSKMHFRKAEGRNQNNLTIVSGLFDRNGKYITGNEKVLAMHLKDDTLAHKLGSGITVKSSFDVKPGAYLVRLVVRDAEGQLSAANGSIEIP